MCKRRVRTPGPWDMLRVSGIIPLGLRAAPHAGSAQLAWQQPLQESGRVPDTEPAAGDQPRTGKPALGDSSVSRETQNRAVEKDKAEIGSKWRVLCGEMRGLLGGGGV